MDFATRFRGSALSCAHDLMSNLESLGLQGKIQEFRVDWGV